MVRACLPRAHICQAAKGLEFRQSNEIGQQQRATIHLVRRGYFPSTMADPLDQHCLDSKNSEYCLERNIKHDGEGLNANYE
jgi:hypothetical protein